MVDIVRVDSHLPIMEGMSHSYPEFNQWLSKLTPGDDTPILTAHRNGNLVGICIGKKTIEETKLRMIRVHPDFQKTGLGIRMIDSMLGLLECDKPHVTVPEEMLHQFSRPFINRYGFDLDEVAKGMYRKGKLEYVFNLANSDRQFAPT